VRVLLDESLPHDLVPLLVGHDVQTVQNLTAFDLRIIILAASRNRIDDIRPLLATLLQAIDAAKPREATWVGA